LKKHDTLPEPDSQYPYSWPVLVFLKKRNFFEKRLAFTPKMYKLSLTRRAANTKKQNKKGGQHYEDR
jgi:hypothetical protein